MKMGRRKAAVLAGVTAVVAAVLGFGGVSATASATWGTSSVVQSTGGDDGSTACSTTSAEYAQRPPECDGSGAPSA